MPRPQPPYVPSVIVTRHRHGTDFYSALTEEEFHRAALWILGEFSGVNPDRDKSGYYPSTKNGEIPTGTPSVPLEMAEALPPSKARDAAMFEWEAFRGAVKTAKQATRDREAIQKVLADQDGPEAVRLMRDLSDYWFERLDVERLDRPWEAPTP